MHSPSRLRQAEKIMGESRPKTTSPSGETIIILSSAMMIYLNLKKTFNHRRGSLSDVPSATQSPSVKSRPSSDSLFVWIVFLFNSSPLSQRQYSFTVLCMEKCFLHKILGQNLGLVKMSAG